MRFSLDFDGTYTADPAMWDAWIRTVEALGHEVYCVSFRPYVRMQKVYKSVGRVIGVDKCVSTDGVAKKLFCDAIDLHIDVWIDDTPEMLITVPQLQEWLDTPFE